MVPVIRAVQANPPGAVMQRRHTGP